MSQGSVLFVCWWYGVLAVLGLVAWLPRANRAPIEWAGVLRIFLIGIAAGLVLYLAPKGLGSIRTIEDFELRLLGALALTWLAAHRLIVRAVRPSRESALAFAGFVGVNLPPLALVASLLMVGGGHVL